MKKSSKQQKAKAKGKTLTQKILRYIFWGCLGLLVLAIFILIILLQHMHIEKK
jgi:hypothetical protein